MTTRAGGVSTGEHASLNLGLRSGDAVERVMANRATVQQAVGRGIRWLRQVHGTTVIDVDASEDDPPADAAWTQHTRTACAAMAADCMPLLFCTQDGQRVAAAHAGWRGLSAGVIEATLHALATPTQEILVWMGPCIGPNAFEVGEDVRVAFVRHSSQAQDAFRARPEHPGKYWCDLYALARMRLQAAGVGGVYGGGYCTYTQADLFFSYRRVQTSGRMAALIWKTI
jgi:polyphenol oxidase